MGWLHSCREKYRRTIVPVRYTLPAVHAAAGPLLLVECDINIPAWFPAAFCQHVFDAWQPNVTFLLQVGGNTVSLQVRSDGVVTLRRWDETREATFSICFHLPKRFGGCYQNNRTEGVDISRDCFVELILLISSEKCPITSSNGGGDWQRPR